MPAVVYEKKGGIAYIILNRPEVHNALDAEVVVRLAEAWQDFAADGDDALFYRLEGRLP
jgi:enoyl-CoA hydratase/carnithine racemase